MARLVVERNNNKSTSRVISTQASSGGESSITPTLPKRVDILPIEVSLLRFLVLVVSAWLFSYSSMRSNAKWVVETYVPWSSWLLHFLVIFGIVGGGWPLTAPMGLLGKPFWSGHGRLLLGLCMAGLVVGFAVALSAFFVKVWPAYPLFPGGAMFGISLFYMTLWWVLAIQTTQKPIVADLGSPPLNMAVHSLLIILMSVAIFQLVDFEGPAAADSSNPGGPFRATYWFGLCVSIIVWVHNFSSILVLQSWPFHILPHPFQHLALTATTLCLGVAVYEIIIACGIDHGFYANAVAASQIGWSLYHTVAFDFWPFHRMRRPKRGFYSFCFSQIVLPFFWVWICRFILEPIYTNMVAANSLYGELFTLDTMIPWFSLHVVAPILLIHQSFFMRWPLPPPGPPMGPLETGNAILLDDDQRDCDELASVTGAAHSEELKVLVRASDQSREKSTGSMEEP